MSELSRGNLTIFPPAHSWVRTSTSLGVSSGERLNRTDERSRIIKITLASTTIRVLVVPEAFVIHSHSSVCGQVVDRDKGMT